MFLTNTLGRINEKGTYNNVKREQSLLTQYRKGLIRTRRESHGLLKRFVLQHVEYLLCTDSSGFYF